jgi:hypothetical protein
MDEVKVSARICMFCGRDRAEVPTRDAAKTAPMQ